MPPNEADLFCIVSTRFGLAGEDVSAPTAAVVADHVCVQRRGIDNVSKSVGPVKSDADVRRGVQELRAKQFRPEGDTNTVLGTTVGPEFAP